MIRFSDVAVTAPVDGLTIRVIHIDLLIKEAHCQQRRHIISFTVYWIYIQIIKKQWQTQLRLHPGWVDDPLPQCQFPAPGASPATLHIRALWTQEGAGWLAKCCLSFSSAVAHVQASGSDSTAAPVPVTTPRPSPRPATARKLDLVSYVARAGPRYFGTWYKVQRAHTSLLWIIRHRFHWQILLSLKSM